MTPNADAEDGVRIVTDPSWSAIHEPRVDDPVESVLAEANQRGRDAAIALLSDVLPGLPLADLAQTTDSGTFHVSHADPKLRDLFDPGHMLDELFQWRGLHGRQLMLVREGDYLPEDGLLAPLGPAGRPRVRTSQVAACMNEGYTVVLNGIELRDPVSMRLTEAFERVFGCAVNINGYLSLRPPMSFGAHWDDQETIILQLLGHKTWELEEPTALSMMKVVHGSATSERPVWKGTLVPGAALYVPRGWGHRVSGVDELTYHYTVTVPRFNGVGVLRRALERRARPEGPLISLPTSAGTESIDGLAPEISDEAIRSAIASFRLETVSRSTQRLSLALAALDGRVEGLWVRCPSPGGWVVQERSLSEVLIGTAGRQYRVDLDLLPEFAEWTDGLARPWPTTAPRQADLVRHLVRLNLLEVIPDPPAWGHPISPPKR